MSEKLLSPRERYENDLRREGFQHDPAQARAVEYLQNLYQELLAESESKPLLARVLQLPAWGKKPEPPKGLYLWGGVGRGKTWLMDSLFESLPFEKKIRTHFHRFMRSVHGELKKLKDQRDPLKLVARHFASQARIICFDEFFVADITDAMILANLLEALFAEGVILVATSNIEPDGLYRDGLQRARFLPAIELIKRHTKVINVDGGIDYRLRALEQASLYWTPLGDQATEGLERFFRSMVADERTVRCDLLVDIEGRKIAAKKEAEDVVWFDFKALCDGPRSQNDYIELAREYHAVIVSDVPELGESNQDQARRFIYLVDEFYDRGVKLIMSAARPINELYRGGRLEFEFARTVSRVQEMQSTEYLARQHRA